MALFEHLKELVSRGQLPEEDERSTDWRYQIDLMPGASALVIGAGWGTTPLALADMGVSVTVTEDDSERISFLRARLAQQQSKSVIVIGASDWTKLSFEGQRFDLISLRPQAKPVSSEVLGAQLAAASRVLKPGGTIRLAVGNRFAFQRFIPRGSSSVSRWPFGLRGYRRLLQNAGFEKIKGYVVLPYHDGISLFSVPLDSSTAFEYFLRAVFPLFFAVSPEVKRRYRLEFLVARFGVGVVRRLRLSKIAHFFVPSFSLIASRRAMEVDAS